MNKQVLADLLNIIPANKYIQNWLIIGKIIHMYYNADTDGHDLWKYTTKSKLIELGKQVTYSTYNHNIYANLTSADTSIDYVSNLIDDQNMVQIIYEQYTSYAVEYTLHDRLSAINGFDHTDPYTFDKFCEEFSCFSLFSFQSEKDMIAIIAPKLAKCLCKLHNGPYLIKTYNSYEALRPNKQVRWTYQRYDATNKHKYHIMDIHTFCQTYPSLIKTYNQINNQPYADGLNLWPKLKAELVHMHSFKCQAVLAHIKLTWANNNQTTYEYILCWLKTLLFNKAANRSLPYLYVSCNTKAIEPLIELLSQYILGDLMLITEASENYLNITNKQLIVINAPHDLDILSSSIINNNYEPFILCLAGVKYKTKNYASYIVNSNLDLNVSNLHGDHIQLGSCNTLSTFSCTQELANQFYTWLSNYETDVDVFRSPLITKQ
jgi:hypothetical protein